MSKKQKTNLILIIVSAVLFVLALICPIYILKLSLFLASYLIAGFDVIKKAVINLCHANVLDENFLMTIATVGALCIKEFEEAVFVMLFYKIGEFFENYAVGKSRKSISSLMDIRPDVANLECDGDIIETDPYDVQVNDVIVIKPGEKIPLDGVIIEGNSSIDTSALTGESIPRDVGVNDEVISGCVNFGGILRVRVIKEFEESTVSKILELVENSVDSKSESEKFITRFSKYYTPIVVICAVLLVIILTIISPENFAENLKRGLMFLVVSCPCALVISIPLTFFGGIGGASKKGILIKGSNHIENLTKCETFVFDKTGTLTKGNFSVQKIHNEKISEDELIKLASGAEYYSNHPISVSLKEKCKVDFSKEDIKDVEEIAGYGVKATVFGERVYVGNEKLMKSADINFPEVHDIGTIVYVSNENEFLGYIVISDNIKDTSKTAIERLKKLGIKKTVMLTGDKKSVAENVAKKLKIDEYKAELLPHEKVSAIKEIKENFVFVGDGINDAPALKTANVGISMGKLGSDAAIEAADIVIMNDDTEKIADAIEISKKTLRIAKQNIILALGIKFIVLILSAIGLGTMFLAVFADVGVTVIAIINAMRMLKNER